MNNDDQSAAYKTGYVIAKIIASAIMAYVITVYNLSFWIAFILILLA
jgi:hypothetical protein